MVWFRNLVILIFAILVVGGGYDTADEKGWFSHSSHMLVTYPKHGWEVGEYLECVGTPGIREDEMDCGVMGAGAVREMSVTYWGRLKTLSRFYKCQREQEEITCRIP